MASEPEHYLRPKNMKRLPGPLFVRGVWGGDSKLKQQAMDPNFGAPARNLTALITLHRLASS